MRKHVFAVVAGVVSFLPGTLVAETIGDAWAAAFMAVYFFVCQFFLSRGHERAYADWSLMLALDASTLLLVSLAAVDGRLTSSDNLQLLFAVLGGTFAGAVVAALAARSGRSWLWSNGRIPRPLVAGAGALVFSLAGWALGEIGWGRTAALPANLGLGLGAAVGAYLADGRRGRLELVLAGALAVVIVAWGIPRLTVGAGFWAGPLLNTATLVAVIFAATGIETSTARHTATPARES